MSISFLDNGKLLSGHLATPIDDNTQAIFAAGIGLLDRIELLDKKTLEALGVSIPPAPSGAVVLERTSVVGTKGLQSFLIGGTGASSVKVVWIDGNKPFLSSVGWTAFGGAGIFKRLKTSSELVMTPSFGVSYAYTWATAEDKESGAKETAESGNFSGAVGMQLDLAPEVSVWGGLSFSFDTSDTALTVGISWH